MRNFLLIFACLVLLPGCNSIGKQSKTVQSEQADSSSQVSAVDYSNLPVIQAIPYDKEFFDATFKQAEEVGDVGTVRGAIVPHHLVGGNIPATFFNYISKQKPSTIVIFGPNHFLKGNSDVLSAINYWNTPYGTVKTNEKILANLYAGSLVKDDLAVMKEEHSIGALMSFIANYLPGAKIVPLIFPYNASTSSIDKMLEKLWPQLPVDAVFVSSIDFSHYQNPTVTAFHDELNRAVVRNFEYNRLDKMEIDSTPSLYALWRSMDKIGAKEIVYEKFGSSDTRMNNPKLEETTSYYSPYFAIGDKGEDRLSSMLFFGDMMLDRNVKIQIDKNGQNYIFTKLAGEENRFFMGTDLIHANLEGPFANSRRATSKEIAFRFDPLLLPMLKKYNFGMFSQANNHSLDMGTAGFDESLKNLNEFGFDVYGAQYRTDDSSIKIKQVGNNTILFIGLNDTNTPVDIEKFKQLILRGQSIDENLEPEYTVVNIHWGEEYKEISNNHQRELAHALIDAGADVIIGTHPHVVQEMEIYKNRPIFYSLGNFVFDQYFSVPTQQGLGVGVILRRDTITLYPIALEQNQSQVSQMPYEKRVKYLNDWIVKSRLGEYKFENNRILINK
ncbi:MAG: AmmeMemoRadiSam system protein B [Candidatus Magasanikbacteria bacterium]|nr:AmmeMemoRadiSam system protein B [Candidatus Magasanikbacteria bacterium]